MRFLLPEFLDDVVLDHVETEFGTRYDAVETEDVKTELRFHQIADGALLHLEGCIGERFDHFLASKRSTQTSPIFCGARIRRILSGQCGELGRGLLHFGQYLFGFCLGRLARLVIGAGVELDQNVAGAAPLGFLEARGVGLVELARLLIADLHLFSQGRLR